MVMEHNAVMVTAPPQSGKTSLLQFLEKKALKSRFFSFVLYLDMAEAKGNLQQALGQFGLEWEPLLKAKGVGTNGRIIILVNEAQWLYGKEFGFWCVIKTLCRRLLPIPVPGLYPVRPLHIVLAASYLCAPTAFAEGLLFDWDFTHTVTLDYNCCPGVGLQFRHQDPEYAELISSFRGQQWKDALSDEALRKDVIEATAGQVGLVTDLLDVVAEKMVEKPFVAGAFDAKVRECLASGEPLASKHTSFKDFLNSAAASCKTHATLGKSLSEKNLRREGVCSCVFETTEWKEAQSMYRQGHLERREVNGLAHIEFISPLHRQIYEQHLKQAKSAVGPPKGGEL